MVPRVSLLIGGHSAVSHTPEVQEVRPVGGTPNVTRRQLIADSPSPRGSPQTIQRRPQRLPRFLTREVLHPHVAVETGRRDRPVDGRVRNLLGMVRLRSPSMTCMW